MTFSPLDHPEITRLAQVVREREQTISRLEIELAELAAARDQLRSLNESLSDQLHEILNSRAWRWIVRYRRGLHGLRRRSWAPRRLAKPASEPEAPTAPAVARPAEAPGSLRSLTLLPELRIEEAADLLAREGDRAVRARMDVICFSIIDWEFRYQRPQQMMSQFAAHGHRVFYISVSRFGTGGPTVAPSVRLVAEGVYEVVLAAARPPNVYGELIDGAGGLLDSLSALRRMYGISSAVAYVMIASWTDVALEARRRWGWTVTYDCMDEWENFTGIHQAVVRAETRLAEGCDLLIVSAERLQRKWRARGLNSVLVRNAVDFEFYRERCQPNALLAGVTHPIAGYFGAIADWFDVELLADVARQRPLYQFVLLGGVFDVDVKALDALPNVTRLGQQPYSTMPLYLYHFDACLIPFKVNRITEATDPVKLYEYLSAGKPVVSTALPELASCADHVYLAADRESFLRQLDRAVADVDSGRADSRRAFAAAHTWSDRYQRVTAALAAAAPPVSIVVVTYNNVRLTQLCLESIIRNTDHPNYEVIVVDNASTDATPDCLRQVASRHPHVRIILNARNQGFSKANNQGLAQSTGMHLVLLNNDTVVPPGWLARLQRHLGDPEVGLVGPMTNFVGNEARAEVTYRTWREMEDFATECAGRHEGLVADIHMLAMFCVAMRRDSWERVGPLDERFGLGMFEDDDYAQRMRAAGYRVVCACDAFVHHVGQAAFKELIARGEYDALFASNRRAYEAKWHVAWKRHEHGPLDFQPARTSGTEPAMRDRRRSAR
jgi:GT2 family glycosyltransferase/glycosyltransferase involved in cell wall biosynthesis